MAGRIQLTTKGVQDVYFTEDPDYSYFVQLFKKHTNYAMSYVKYDISQHANFGKSVRFTIPKDQGDLIKTISLDVELAPIAGANITRIGYVESIGHAMIEEICMFIGDKLIQRIPSDYLQIYSEQNYTQSKQNALDKLIGKYPERTSDVPVASGVILGHLGPATTTKKLFIDIPFYFYRRPELAIPLCAMCYQEVEIEIKFRDISDCVVKTDDATSTTLVTTTLDYELSSNVTFTENVVAASTDGLKLAIDSGSSTILFKRVLKNELLDDPTIATFNGTGVVSQGLNTIINSGGIHRYENGTWNVYNISDANIDTTNVKFSDDGTVIVQVADGYWTWNGNGYDFISDLKIYAVSRDGNIRASYDSVVNRVTTTLDGSSFFNFNVSSSFDNAFLSEDGSKIAIQYDNSLLTVYQYSNQEWIPYGQTIGVYESQQLTLTSDGNTIFIFNPNEGTGTGRVYKFDPETSLWTEVYRHRGIGTNSSINDIGTILTVGNEYVKIQEITRTVENYDDIVIKTIENITNTGGAVYGAGYQGLDTQNVFQFILNQSSTYTLNTSRTISPRLISHITLSENGLELVVKGQSPISSLAVYTRKDVSSQFSENAIKIDGINTRVVIDSNEDVQRIYMSPSGKYFAVASFYNGTHTRVKAYEIIDGIYKNIYYVGQGNENEVYDLYDVASGSYNIKNIMFSENEDKIIIFGSDIRSYTISDQSVQTKSVSDVYLVSKDESIYVTWSANYIQVYNYTDNTKFGLKLFLENVLELGISDDNTIISAVTPTYTYLYETDGVGWKLKTSLFPSLKANFVKHELTSNGTVLNYVTYENTTNRTFVISYVLQNNVWYRIQYRNENLTQGAADVNKTGNYYVMISGTNKDVIKVYELVKQQKTVEITVSADANELYPKQMLSCKICLGVVYLDDLERRLLKSVKKDYVITQIQQNTFDIPKAVEEHKIKMDFINPVKEIYFVLRRENLKQYNDFVSTFDYDNDALTSENKLIFYENLKSLELTLDGTPYLDEYTGNFIFLKAIQSAIHHAKTPLIRRFYSYSFACEPEKYYPTGQVNFSLINNQLAKLKVTQNLTKNRKLDIYALSYNVLRIDKGITQLLFNTK
jgi:hypothetical protein